MATLIGAGVRLGAGVSLGSGAVLPAPLLSYVGENTVGLSDTDPYTNTTLQTACNPGGSKVWAFDEDSSPLYDSNHAGLGESIQFESSPTRSVYTADSEILALGSSLVFTIAMRFQLDVSSGNRAFFAWDNGTTTNRVMIQYLSGTGWRIVISAGASRTASGSVIGSATAVNTLVYVCNGSDLWVYENGSLAIDTADISGSAPSGLTASRWGAIDTSGTPSSNIDGNFDRLNIYDFAATPTQVAAILASF